MPESTFRAMLRKIFQEIEREKRMAELNPVMLFLMPESVTQIMGTLIFYLFLNRLS